MSNVRVRTNEGIAALLRWLEIREEWGHPFRANLSQLKCDIDHSALLRRLLEGKEVFPEPPPRAHSYPNYNLVENGFDEPLEVHEYTTGVLCDDGPVLVIDQSVWQIVEKVGEEEWIATYEVLDQDKLRELAHGLRMDETAYLTDRPSGDLPMRLAKSRWRVKRVEGTRTGVDPESSLSKLWRVERVP